MRDWWSTLKIPSLNLPQIICGVQLPGLCTPQRHASFENGRQVNKANQWHCNKRQSYDWPMSQMSIITVNLVLRKGKEPVERAQVHSERQACHVMMSTAQFHILGSPSLSVTSQRSLSVLNMLISALHIFLPADDSFTPQHVEDWPHSMLII